MYQEKRESQEGRRNPSKTTKSNGLSPISSDKYIKVKPLKIISKKVDNKVLDSLRQSSKLTLNDRQSKVTKSPANAAPKHTLIGKSKRMPSPNKVETEHSQTKVPKLKSNCTPKQAFNKSDSKTDKALKSGRLSKMFSSKMDKDTSREPVRMDHERLPLAIEESCLNKNQLNPQTADHKDTSDPNTKDPQTPPASAEKLCDRLPEVQQSVAKTRFVNGDNVIRNHIMNSTPLRGSYKQIQRVSGINLVNII